MTDVWIVNASPNTSDVVKALRDSGLRLDDRMVEAAVRSVGEGWP